MGYNTWGRGYVWTYDDHNDGLGITDKKFEPKEVEKIPDTLEGKIQYYKQWLELSKEDCQGMEKAGSRGARDELFAYELALLSQNWFAS